jgi:hypothetical protein
VVRGVAGGACSPRADCQGPAISNKATQLQRQIRMIPQTFS